MSCGTAIQIIVVYSGILAFFFFCCYFVSDVLFIVKPLYANAHLSLMVSVIVIYSVLYTDMFKQFIDIRHF